LKYPTRVLALVALALILFAVALFAVTLEAPAPVQAAAATITPSATLRPTRTSLPTVTPTSTPTEAVYENECLEAWATLPQADYESGYCWLEKYWVPGVVVPRMLYYKQPSLVWGYVSHYDPGVMPSAPGYVGGVALEMCADVGETVWIKPGSMPWDGPFLVVDCARPVGVYVNAVIFGIAVEVDQATFLRWGRYRGAAIVSKKSPETIGGELPIYIGDWFMSQDPFGR
jgi:hypothetical protein